MVSRAWSTWRIAESYLLVFNKGFCMWIWEKRGVWFDAMMLGYFVAKTVYNCYNHDYCNSSL